MKTLIALRMLKKRGRNAGTKAEMQARQKHNQRRGRGGGSAADIKFQPRRVTQTCPRSNRTRRVERVLVETRVVDTDKDCRGTRWGA